MVNESLHGQDASSEILGELSGRPDLVIGNYSDGNLVASLIAHHLGVTQVLLPISVRCGMISLKSFSCSALLFSNDLTMKVCKN